MQKGISHPDLEADLLDHVCSDVETRMADGESFEHAFGAAMARFGETELRQVQQKTAALLDGRKVFYPGIRQSVGLLLFFFALYYFAQFAIINPLVQLDYDFYQLHHALIGCIHVFGCLLLVIAYARMELRGRGFTQGAIFPFGPVPAGIFPIIAGLMLVAGFWMEIATLWIPIPDAVRQGINFRLTHSPPVSVFLFSILVFPVLTEVLYRGFILRGMLRKRHAPLKAILVSSLLYGLCWNPYFFGGTFLVGLFCGWLFYRTGSLIPPVAAQIAAALSNHAGIFFFKPQTYEQLKWKFVFGNDALYYGAGLASLLVTVLLLRWLSGIFNRHPPEAVLSLE